MNPKTYSNINNYLIIFTSKVITWGQTDKQTNKQTYVRTDGQIFTQCSGMRSHSLRGAGIHCNVICATQSDITYDTYETITYYLSGAHKQTELLL